MPLSLLLSLMMMLLLTCQLMMSDPEVSVCLLLLPLVHVMSGMCVCELI